MKYKMNPEPPLPPHYMEVLIEEEELRIRVQDLAREVTENLGRARSDHCLCPQGCIRVCR